MDSFKTTLTKNVDKNYSMMHEDVMSVPNDNAKYEMRYNDHTMTIRFGYLQSEKNGR